MMKKSTTRLHEILDRLQHGARERGLTDTQWSARAGIRKETLSRLRGRDSCDFATLEALAHAVGVVLMVARCNEPTSADGLLPDSVDREFEERLLGLCDSNDLTSDRWRELGPGFFMGGLAVMLASVAGRDRRALLELAEQIHPGITQVEVFALWLERSPVRPSRFLPMLATERHAA